MNILVFSWRDPKHPFAGGAEQVMHEHMKGWIEKGNKVTLFSSYFKNAKKEEILDRVEIIRRGGQFLGVQLSAFMWYLFNRPKFDLVVDQFHGLPFFTPLYVRTSKLAVIQEVAKEVWFLNSLPRPFNWIVGIIGYLGEPFIFLFYRGTHFMTGSLSAKEDVIKLGIPKGNITVVPHGVILDIPKNMPRKEKRKTIVFLGALARDKGVEDALYAFSFLNKQSVFNFWVIGKGESSYQVHLKNLSKKLQINPVFFGFVSQKKKFELLSKSHVLINPSVREGWGLVNIEANSVRTPVVAYNSPGLIDSVKDGVSGIICKENSPECLSKTIFDLLKDKSRYEKYQKGALLWSKNFSWKKSKQLSLSLITAFKKTVSINSRMN